MIYADWYETGNLFGVKYRLSNIGNGLKPHAHPATEQHNVICLRGKCAIFGPNLQPSIIKAGEISDFDSTRVHSIVGLEPDTIILNICLFGKPDAYKDVTEKHLEVDFYPQVPHDVQEFINNNNS